jgi:tRNA G18 (ribose-2'-O)-methylase SpoU
MDGVTGFNVHRGCLAIGERPTPGPWIEVASSAQTLVVLEGIGNADNVGGVFRNARALGANAVLLGPGCADPLYRKAIRTSMGAALLVPFANASPWPEALVALRDAGFAVVAMTPAADARPLHEVVARLRGARAALLFGHEGEGLTPEAVNACDHRARVPMSGFDSLNVASACAIGLYELMRRP